MFDNKEDVKKEIDYLYKFNTLLCEKTGFVIGSDGIKGLNSIIKNTHIKISLHRTCSLNDVYGMFIARINDIPLQSFDYPQLINLLWSVSNNILIGWIVVLND